MTARLVILPPVKAPASPTAAAVVNAGLAAAGAALVALFLAESTNLLTTLPVGWLLFALFNLGSKLTVTAVLGTMRAGALITVIMSGAKWARLFMSKRDSGVISKPRAVAAPSSAPAVAGQELPNFTSTGGSAPQPVHESAQRLTSTAKITDADIVREAEEGSADGATALLLRAQHRGHQPSAAAFQSVVRAHAAEARPAQATMWIEHMLAENFRPEAQVFNCVMAAHVQAADGGAAETLLGRMTQLQWPSLMWVQAHWAAQLGGCDPS